MFFGNRKKNDKSDKKSSAASDDKRPMENSQEISREAVTKEKAAPGEIKGYMRAIPIVLVAVALFTLVCLITGNEVGSFGSFFADFLKGLFSYMAYAIPVLLVLHAIFYLNDVTEKRVLSRVIFSVVILLTLSEMAYIIPTFAEEPIFTPQEFYQNGINYVGGGFFGGVIGFALKKVFGRVGVIIIAALAFSLYITYSFSGKHSSLKLLWLKLVAAFANFGAKIESGAEKKLQEKKERHEKKRARDSERKAAALMDDGFFTTDNGLESLEIPELNISETKTGGIGESYSDLKTDFKHEEGEDHTPTSSSTTREYGDFDENASGFRRADSSGYNENDIVFEANPRSDTSNRPEPNPYGLDDSAEAIFTEEFDPYDIATNEKYRYKPSTKTENAASNSATGTFSENISAVNSNTKKAYNESASQASRDDSTFTSDAQERQRREKQEADERLERERIAREDARRREAERAAEEERIRRAEAARIAEEEARRREIESIVDYSDFGNENQGFNASFRANNPFRFARETGEHHPREEASHQADSYSSSHTEYSSRSFVFDDSDNNYSDTASHSVEAAHDTSYTESAIDENDAVSASSTEENTITVSRTRIDTGFSTPSGLEFVDDEDEAEEDELDFSEPIEETTASAQEEIPPEEQNPAVMGYRSMFDIFSDDTDNSIDTEEASDDDEIDEDYHTDGVDIDYEEDAEDYDSYDEDESMSEAGFEDDDFDEAPPFDAPAKKADTQKPKKKVDYSNYKFPPIDFLAKGQAPSGDLINEETQRNADKLIKTLESFGIRATVCKIERGPRITRYSIVPAKGIRVNQIEKLVDDLALALAAKSIRIEAPIPGKSAVGIEVPNESSTNVSLRELIESDEFASSDSTTAVCIGKSVEGNNVVGDLADMPHLLIAGATGMGKSVCINALITSMLYKARPDEVKFIMIDPKKIEFAPYDGIPHLLVPVVTEVKDAAGALCWAVDEMNRRYDVFRNCMAARNLKSYNDRVKGNPALGDPLPKIIIFIDELNDLMLKVRDPVESLIMDISQKARAAGIHLVIGTQRPSVNVITGVIKANIPSRIACKVSSGIDSRTIIEQIGAERLLGKGDMLYAPGGTPSPKRVQGAFVSEEETQRIVEFVAKQSKGVPYDEEAIADMRRATQKCDRSNDEDDDFSDGGVSSGGGYLHDKKFLSAVEIAINNGGVATSFLQRKLKIGYSKAAQYIDIMEDLGIVGEKNGSKPREVLISKQEWLEKLSRLTDD